MEYTLITFLGGVIACIFVVGLMADLIEFRIKKKAAIIWTAVFTVFFIILITIMYGFLGSTRGGQLYLFFATPPLAIFFYTVAQYRDGRLFFSLFFTQLIHLSILCLTHLIDGYFPTRSHIVHSVLRFVIYPLIFLLIHFLFSKKYRAVQSHTPIGWGKSAFITFLFYILVLYTYNFPASLYERPSDIPIFILILVIAFLFTFQTISTMHTVYENNEMKMREVVFAKQIAAIKDRINQINISEKKLAVERHDIRHRYNVILGMLNSKNVSEAMNYINESSLHLDDVKHISYCDNTIINATMDIFASTAESNDITLDVKMDVPSELPVSSEEFSIVISNALDNAINATKMLPADKRHIQIKCIHTPKLMVQIINPISKDVHFDKDGLPSTNVRGHGIGVWSIEQYCEKNNAISEYLVEDNTFVFRLAHMS